MKVIKNINNNVAICIDNDGNEVVAFGKGIGFKTPPYVLTDLNKITKTYYNIDQRYFGLLNVISEEIFEITGVIVTYTQIIVDSYLNPNLVFTLADHIQFAIQRNNSGMLLKFSSQYDLKHFNPKEVEVGEYAVKLIEKKLKIKLPEDEVYGIAMHIINSEINEQTEEKQVSSEKIVDQIVEIIENYMGLEIDKASFNFSRFASHLEYLFERIVKNEMITTKNFDMFQSIAENYPRAYNCSLEIRDYLLKSFNWYLEEEELLYLMLHINRLCTRQGYKN
ncbi:PRD domain-containing protein [Fundicoccus culcitae]|uniref:PRD domain-containing protein n=1 Tax=Fundicoccus culcitae TaxID=2969821 RepID=A0ABY5P8V2_9LACT|nr:PRD domain-containing protein [Fundicoccus culcitae]UUX35182.1 PRD domain-containing protein [Fundicoccus culcitae]